MISVKAFRRFDWLFFSGVMVLVSIGVMMIYSTGLASSGDRTLWLKQLLAVGLGLAGLFFFSSLDYRFFRKNSSVIYLLAVIMLVAVLLFGVQIRGSTRWFDLGFFNFQPAELSKLALIVLLAKYFQVQRPFLKKFRFVILSFAYAALPAILIMQQPDLGSALVLFAIWGGMLLFSPVPKRYLLYLLIIFLIVSAVSWNFVLHDYQKDRVHTFLEPTLDPQGRGYNVIQSMVAIGSGGLGGRGLARGLQSQLRFLPERQTDFIFASTVEELGLLGGALILLCLGFMLFRIIAILRRTPDTFGAMLAAGIFFLFLSQAVINIGMNLGLLPVTGITLPFVSYGGSSLMIMLWVAGIVESLAINSAPVRFR